MRTIIANQIYGIVYKRLMEHEKVAKFFIESLLNKSIECIRVEPQKYSHTGKLAGVAVYPVDYLATIKTATGGNTQLSRQSANGEMSTRYIAISPLIGLLRCAIA